MVIDIKMCRFDNVPWGFRLVGGADYDYPLTVVKVTEGSIADEAGLRADDVIVRINDTAAAPLTHDEANQQIRSSGSVFYFGVFRENEDDCYTGPTKFPVKPALNEIETVSAEGPVLELQPVTETTERVAEDFQETLYIPELPDRPCSALSENTEIKLVEEEIAAVLSGESEVLQEHNVMGIFPKPGVCMSSDVLRSLNEEAIKTKAERDKEIRKWSTFLQKPNRPIPLSKQEMEAQQRAANAYKVVIKKSTPSERKSVTPVIAAESQKSVEREATPPQAEPQATNEVGEPAKEDDADEPLPTDSEVPDLEEMPQADEKHANGSELADDVEAEMPAANGGGHEDIEKDGDASENAEQEEATTADVAAESNEAAVDVAGVPITTETTNAETIIKTEEELLLEKQLVDVQKQLAALSSLPSTIQTTLDAVTKQLAELLPTFKLQHIEAEKEMPTEAEACMTQAEESVTGPTDVAEVIVQSNVGENGEVERTQIGHDANCDLEVELISRTKGDGAQEEVREEEQGLRKAKRHDVIEELEEHLERKNNPKRSKRAFGPLTPSSERPVVLPGGRRWYRPKDAYNDEFIAETLSAQAELITGTTLGVNFMKYQRPDRKIDLNRSEVYKVIHHLDRQPVRGIEVRAPKVAAESDIRELVQS